MEMVLGNGSAQMHITVRYTSAMLCSRVQYWSYLM